MQGSLIILWAFSCFFCLCVLAYFFLFSFFLRPFPEPFPLSLFPVAYLAAPWPPRAPFGLQWPLSGVSGCECV